MVSINDVARHAGVSNATVSRVLAKKPHVSDAMRQRVMQAVNELGYQPDSTAQRLRMHSTSKVVGLIVSDILNPHFSAVVRGVEDFAYEHEMSIILCNADSKLDRQQFYLNMMQSERAAGLIITPQNSAKDGESLDHLRQSGTSIVVLDCTVKGYSFDTVQVDSQRGAFEAVSHLIDNGYERIGIVAGPLNQSTAQERLQGYKLALEQAGLSVAPGMIQSGDYSRASGYACATGLLTHNDPPEALFVSSNMLALGVLEAIKARKLRIPDDLALVTFDDNPLFELLQPTISTVAQPTYEIGREALRLLKRRIEEPNAAYANVVLPTKLIMRESSQVVARNSLHLPDFVVDIE